MLDDFRDYAPVIHLSELVKHTNTTGSTAISSDLTTRRLQRTLAIVLLPIFALIASACSSVEEGSWVTIENIDHRDDTSVYYVLEKKSPFGENEKNEDSQGYRRICLLLEFIPNPTGNDGYSPLPIDDREWHLCRELKLVEKPSFDSSLIQRELQSFYHID